MTTAVNEVTDQWSGHGTDHCSDMELSVLDACIDCDDEALYEILQNGVTYEHVNERDKSGRVSTQWPNSNFGAPGEHFGIINSGRSGSVK